MPDISNSILTPVSGVENPHPLTPYAEHGFTMLWLTTRNGRRFMLKGLSPAYRSKPEFRQLLRKEFELLVTLDSESVVRVWDIEENSSTGLCIVMEYIQGVTLSEYLEGKSANAGEKLSIAIQLAEALTYIHSSGISHRDLKPDNIIVIPERKRLKLIDFGLGDGSEFTTYKQSGGTRTYGAPEQINDATGDSRSDVYSFGVILREMGIAKAIAKKCLRVNPDDRPTIAQVAKDLKRKRTALQKYAIPSIVAVAVLSLGMNLYLLNNTFTTSHQPTTASSNSDAAEVQSTHDIQQDTTATHSQGTTPESVPQTPQAEPPVAEKPSTVITVDNTGDSLFENACSTASKLIAANKKKLHPDLDYLIQLEIYESQNAELKKIATSMTDSMKNHGLRQSAISQYEAAFWFNVTKLTTDSFGQ
ncbi:MAG: serine/threonine protein kinase [Bacteroides sp.]|nr:serine/threonine protein kinase [Bacteroides sp.]MCM1389219.1 serine/threonine protein kinase [Bacteroides sp.]